MPEIIEDLLVPRQGPEVFGYEPPQREDLQERAAGEQHDQKHGHEKAGNCIANHDHAGSPDVEAGAVADSLADTERNGDRVGDQRHPKPERDGDRHTLRDERQNARVSEIALAEVEAQIVPDHLAEAFIGRLVETELLLEARDEFWVETLRTAIFRRAAAHVASGHTLLAAAREVAAAAAEFRRCACVSAGQLGDQPFHGSTRRELHDDESHQHDAEHRRNDQQESAKDIGGQLFGASCRCASSGKRVGRRSALEGRTPHPQPLCLLDSGSKWNPTERPVSLQVGKARPDTLPPRTGKSCWPLVPPGLAVPCYRMGMAPFSP